MDMLRVQTGRVCGQSGKDPGRGWSWHPWVDMAGPWGSVYMCCPGSSDDGCVVLSASRAGMTHTRTGSGLSALNFQFAPSRAPCHLAIGAPESPGEAGAHIILHECRSGFHSAVKAACLISGFFPVGSIPIACACLGRARLFQTEDVPR